MGSMTPAEQALLDVFGEHCVQRHLPDKVCYGRACICLVCLDPCAVIENSLPVVGGCSDDCPYEHVEGIGIQCMGNAAPSTLEEFIVAKARRRLAGPVGELPL